MGCRTQCPPARLQFDKIMVYCQKVNYTADWGFLLTNIVRMNPAGALEFAQKVAATEVRERNCRTAAPTLSTFSTLSSRGVPCMFCAGRVA